MDTTTANSSTKSIYLSTAIVICVMIMLYLPATSRGQTVSADDITLMLAPEITLIKPSYSTTQSLKADKFTTLQPLPYMQGGGISWPGFALTSATLAGLYAGIFSYEQDRRWNGPRSDFFFAHTLNARGVDKAGHFYATKAQASLISNLYTFSNVSPRTANLIGTGIALSVQTLVELKDGRVADRGFGVYDEIANALGASWFYAREHSPFMQRFQVRWLYYPSDDRDLLKPGYRFTEDYTGHSYWLSAKVWDLLPFYWPKAIVPALGMSLNDWVPNSDQQGYYSIHLSLNPDFNYILPDKSRVARALADLFNEFYIPAPAIQLYPDLGFKLVFYGQK